MMPHWEILPALVAGNSVVFKPSEETPLCGQAYADILAKNLPTNVLQIIHGADDQGKALVAADVDLIVFAGSRQAGKSIMAEARKGLKRVILELGGKDPMVVLDDADISKAASFAARNSFRNAGQVCVSTERIYVDESVHDPFVEALVEATQKIRMGDGMQEGVKMGPMVNARQRNHVLAQIDDATAKGATVAFQGEGAGDNFVPPTILTHVTPAMDIAKEETFGPVACVFSVQGDQETLDGANDTPYGLGAVVYGGDERASALARKLTAGMVGINQGLSSAPGCPWVGARQSGMGFHTGPEGHRQFAQTRVVSQPVG